MLDRDASLHHSFSVTSTTVEGSGVYEMVDLSDEDMGHGIKKKSSSSSPWW